MSVWRFLSQIFLILLALILLFNQSLDRYIEQKYHISLTQDIPIFKTLALPSVWLNNIFKKHSTMDSPKNFYSNIIEQTPKEPPLKEHEEELQKEAQEHSLEKNYKMSIIDDRLIIRESSNFLFIGDSMMQGVGVILSSELKKRGMNVLNIAKQSTGLTYKKFFDWPDALKKSLEENPQIDALVVMLGANDPWNIHKVKYGSKRWDDIYLSRIKSILSLAREYNLPVFWYEIPLLKDKSLSRKIIHLNELYREASINPMFTFEESEELQKDRKEETNERNSSKEDWISNLDSLPNIESKQNLFHVFFIQTNPIFSPNQQYTSHITINGSPTLVRTKDGIHFTTKGSRLLSDMLLDLIDFELNTQDSLESQAHSNNLTDSVKTTIPQME